MKIALQRNIQILGCLLLLASLLSASCGKDEEEDSVLSCRITSPNAGDQIYLGSNIMIQVEAHVNMGNITQVDIYVQDSLVQSNSTYPYGYLWHTLDSLPGSYTIRTQAFDNKNASCFDELQIELIPLR